MIIDTNYELNKNYLDQISKLAAVQRPSIPIVSMQNESLQNFLPTGKIYKLI